MQGAREYAGLISSGQYGRLFVRSGEHARGRTFHIWVLPDGVRVKGSYPVEHDRAVEVYGVRGGQPGWTEWYGWLHDGPWVDDFKVLVTEKQARREKKKLDDEQTKEAAAKEEHDRITRLLSTYR